MTRPAIVATFYFLSLLHQREQEEAEAGDHKEKTGAEPNVNANPPNAPVGNNGRRAGTVNYSDEELEDLMEVIVEVLPIDSEEWNTTVVCKHAANWPFQRNKKSIRNKYSATKRKKSSTGNPHMPRYVKLARKAHYLIGKKANLGTGEEAFDVKQGFTVSEAEEGVERIPSAEVQQGRAPIIAGDTSTIDSSIVRPAKVQSSTPTSKRPYSKVPDAAVFNEFLISQQARDKENHEMALEQSKIAKEHSLIAKEATQIAKETNLMWKNALTMAMACFQQWQNTQQQNVLQSRNDNDNVNDNDIDNNAYQPTNNGPCDSSKGEESHGEKEN
ncbi:unnamed protein product [Pseudo-nitzschia multistriata]|uniref:Uncharacterized protein n=1 Tax=Pseudo-nitzschia multistriata TaxID=183589 RepID=A0A448Z2T8_9STRA|nr:unnamed protein product [Pseudo-nitzschia multistriata]